MDVIEVHNLSLYQITTHYGNVKFNRVTQIFQRKWESVSNLMIKVYVRSTFEYTCISEFTAVLSSQRNQCILWYYFNWYLFCSKKVGSAFPTMWRKRSRLYNYTSIIQHTILVGIKIHNNALVMLKYCDGLMVICHDKWMWTQCELSS